MQWLIQQKELLEVISYLSVIIGAAAVVFTSIQIYYAKITYDLAKRESIVKSQREAIILSGQLCEKFAETNDNKFRLAVNDLDTYKIKKRWSLKNSGFNIDSFDKPSEIYEWFKKIEKSPQLGENLVGLLNYLESMSIYFVKGAADEEAAFPAIGEMFCMFVETAAPLIYVSRQNRSKTGSYKYTVDLYRTWSNRIKIENLNALKTDIEQNLSNIESSKFNIIGGQEK